MQSTRVAVEGLLSPIATEGRDASELQSNFRRNRSEKKGMELRIHIIVSQIFEPEKRSNSVGLWCSRQGPYYGEK